VDGNLTRVLANHQSLDEWLRSEYPDVDDDTLRDTLEGMSTLPEAIAAILRSHLDDVALAVALRGRLSDMQDRLARIEGRAEKKRTLVASVMEQASLRKITQPDFTASLRPTPPPLVVISESEIPAAYWKPQPPKLDRKGLIADLSSGVHVSGATLGNGHSTISVRTR
jgi:hypothetical protein